MVSSFRSLVFTASFIALTALAAGGASAQGPATGAAEVAKSAQVMTYEVYAGGINAVRAQLDVNYVDPQSYNLTLVAHTKGFLAKLVPWEGTFSTHGWRLDDGKERPELHKSTANWRDEQDFKEYHYTKEGTFEKLVVLEPGAPAPVTEEIPPELTQGTTDALTATLEIMQKVAASGSCEGRDEVFDGKRRFALVFRHAADDMLTPTEYNVFQGRAARCEVEVIPVSGEWDKKPRGWMSIQEQGRDKAALPTVWLAKIAPDGPAVPVKIRIKTEYGVLFMHLINYSGDGKSVMAQAMAEERGGGATGTITPVSDAPAAVIANPKPDSAPANGGASAGGMNE